MVGRVWRDGKMSTVMWVASLKCSNPNCGIGGRYIPLPYSILQQITGSQPDWPRDDWQAFVMCRDCGSGRIYSKANRDVHWGFSQQFSPDIWVHTSFLQIELKCAQESCETPVRVHMLFDKNWRPQRKTLERKLSPLIGAPECPNKHQAQQPLRFRAIRALADFGEATL